MNRLSLVLATIAVFGALLSPATFGSPKRCRRHCAVFVPCNRQCTPIFTLNIVDCAQYLATPGSPDNVYYALECETNPTCSVQRPVPLYGIYDCPMTCPNCVAVELRAYKPKPLSDFQGYDGPMKDDSFDPTDPVQTGGFPPGAATTPPVIVDRRYVCFNDTNGKSVFAVIFSVLIKPQSECIAQGRNDCLRQPRNEIIEIGYQVMPKVDPTDPTRTVNKYEPYYAAALAKKFYRVSLSDESANPPGPMDYGIVLMASEPSSSKRTSIKVAP